MASPSAHAKLGPSGAHRWLNCTAAPGFEQQFPSTTSSYAREGTLAHEYCELAGRLKFGQITNDDWAERVGELQRDEMFNPEMLDTALFYANALSEAGLAYDQPPAVFFEVRVPLTEWIPEGFGSCDCCMIGGDTLRIFDYKHGKGVRVDSENNPQMRLYALGALAKFRPVYGDKIKRVITAIIQPRITEDISEETLTVEDLLAWGETVKPRAQAAFTGVGAEFHAGEWCRFCAGKALCRARADGYTALEEFAAMSPDDDRLSEDDIADLLQRGKGLVAWYEDLQGYARDAILAGRPVPGWKVVEGRSRRAFTDTDKALAALIAAGYQEPVLYERKPLTLAALEKVCGKARFAEICGEFVTTPPGSPTLVEESDKRAPYSTAAAEAEAMSG